MRDRRRLFHHGDWDQMMEHRRKNRVYFGIAIAVIGVVLMLRTLGIFNFDIEFSWPVILIVIGLLSGIKHGFRNHSWWILTLIGVANLTPQFTIMGHPSRHLVWPFALILGGIMIAIRPRRHDCRPARMGQVINNETDLDVDVVFGGRKEVVTSRDFKGGNLSVTFGGVELNLSQADFAPPSIVLDCRVTFGGIEMVVPSHWEIRNEISPSFGAVEDERVIQTATTAEQKRTLILRGSCTFGSIQLKSY